MKVINEYSFDTATNKLTLYAGVPLDFCQLVKIHNTTKKRPVYDSNNNALLNVSTFTVTNTGATCILTCSYVEEFEITDVFQILISEKQTAGEACLTSMEFLDTDDLTTEKITDALQLEEKSPSGYYGLSISKPTDATAGDLTVNVYNQVSFDGLTITDVFLTAVTVSQVASETTNDMFIKSGLGVGEGTVKLGFVFASDSASGITVLAAIHPV